jgi:hypothetical protein
MPQLNSCLDTLRRLIATGDPCNIPEAEKAINEYLDATPPKACKSGLWLIQEDVLVQLNAGVGVQRSFAETVYAYLDKKLME